jgi:hypothetical protein
MIFEDPRVVVSVNNSFGFPMSVTFSKLSATSSTGTNIPVTINGTDSILDLTRPLTPNDSAALTTRTFNKDNSNIKNALNAQPKQVAFTISAKANPKGKVSLPTPPFLKSDSKAEINLDVVFPLWGKCTKFGTNDVFGFDYGELFGNATGIEFKVWINNGLPAGGTLTLIFCGKDTAEIDRITTDLSIIEPSPYDKTTGISTGITEHDFTLKFYKLEDLPKIKLCKVSTAFHTPYTNGTDASGGVEIIKVMSDNTMQMKIGMKVKMAYKVGI